MRDYENGVHFSGDGGVDANAACGADIQSRSSTGTFVLRRARYLSETGAPALNAEQHHAITNLVDEVDQDTKRNMIVQNLRMVVGIARRYLNRGPEFAELVRVGNLGLIHALEKFEPEGGFCFTTYVTWCVSRQIELAIMQHNASASLPISPVAPVTFDSAARKHAETCPGYPAGCWRKPT
jgi:RNA polymerase nonessential primary-like sigma factor